MRSFEQGEVPYLLQDILRIGGPAEWKRLDAWARNTDAGRALHSLSVRQEIEAAATNPEDARAAQAKRERSEAFSRATRDHREEEAIRVAKDSDPASYIKGFAASASRARRLRRAVNTRSYRRPPISPAPFPTQYVELAGYARYIARDPRTAIAMYEQASAAARKRSRRSASIRSRLRSPMRRVSA